MKKILTNLRVRREMIRVLSSSDFVKVGGGAVKEPSATFPTGCVPPLVDPQRKL